MNFTLDEASLAIIKGTRVGAGSNPPVRDEAKKVIKEQGNVEAFELLELTVKILCVHCHKYTTSCHDNCKCGRTLISPNRDPAIKDQIHSAT